MSGIGDVTLVTIETIHHDLAARALQETLDRIPFAKVVVFSDKDILPGSTWVPIQPTTTMYDYCDLLLKGMWPFIGTSHAIFQQWDAMVHDQTKWTDEFLDYDYMGAVWPWQPPGQNVGNGGFSLRSRKLLNALRYPSIQMIPEGPHGVQEDNYISIVHRDLLRDKFNIKIAPPALAQQFSYELGDYNGSMAFHAFWNIINFMPRDTVDFFVTHRPDNMFNEMHRAHHNIMALAMTNRLDLLEQCVTDIQACPDYANLFQWLSAEDFNNKADVLNLIAQ